MTVVWMWIGFTIYIASLMDLYCAYVNVDCVDVNSFPTLICFLKEQMGCYVAVDWFLDIDLFGI